MEDGMMAIQLSEWLEMKYDFIVFQAHAKVVEQTLQIVKHAQMHLIVQLVIQDII